MESRRIVKSGNTSYIISLPIGWIRRNKLAGGKSVHILEDSQGDLVLTAEKRRNSSQEEVVTIKVDGKNRLELDQELQVAYIRDASSIIFDGKEIKQKTTIVLDLVRFYIGLDVIEQSAICIVAKNFFALDRETSPHLLFKKMDIVNRASFELLRSFGKKGFGRDDFFELQKFNEQVRRLDLLSRKSTWKIFENPYMMRDLRTTYVRVSRNKIFTLMMGLISTNFISLGKLLLFLDANAKSLADFSELFEKCYQGYIAVIGFVNSKDQQSLKVFLRSNPELISEQRIKSTEDPLLVQALLILGDIWDNIFSIGKEASY